MTVSDGILRQLENRRAQTYAVAERILTDARAQGREHLSKGEDARWRQATSDLTALDQRIAELSGETEFRAEIDRNLAARFGALGADGARPTPARKTPMNDRAQSHLVYNRRPGAPSWVRDLVLASPQVNRDDDGSCRRRLQDHARQVAEDPAYTEYRDLSRIDGEGGFAVAPIWMLSEYIELARPGRPFADICQARPLPTTDVVNIPKVMSGTTVTIQPSDNVDLSTVGGETDLTDAFISAPVRTLAGQQGVSIQLLEMSQIDFSEVIFQDLLAAYDAALDTQLLAGSGTNGQVLGLDLTPGIQSVNLTGAPSIQTFYSAVAHSIGLVHSKRFLPPTHLLISPLRWSWILSLLDTTDRPLVLPRANNFQNAAGIEGSNVASQGIVGEMCGISIVVDPNLGTTAGGGSGVGTDDVAYLGRFSDCLLFEGFPRARVLPETRATSLTVLLQVFAYAAFSAQRYSQSIVQLTGLSAPTF